MKGYLQTCSLRNLKLYQDNFDLKLFIVRAPGKIDCNKYGLIHVPELSPSPALYSDYMRWKAGKFTSDELKLINNDPSLSFKRLFKPIFISEMNTRTDLIVNINRIKELLSQGKNILLICFCGDYEECHRSLIADNVSKAGYEVKLG